MGFVFSELIAKKRDGGFLSSEELSFVVEGITSKAIPDYQLSAWLMACFLRGMTPEETQSLTRFMKNSGESFSWKELSGEFANCKIADKHSTGGVGDKVSIVLAPLCAELGLTVPMMSGRGLAHTGGTVDKLLSIPGFRMELSKKEMTQTLLEIGFCMISQSDKICPADKKLYALRDVTATVPSVPLITASILSKKWAEGVHSLLIDLKCGQAAFMKTPAEARGLAHSLVDTAKALGLNAQASITRMSEPLGAFVGNALEIRECLHLMQNEFPTKRHEEIAEPLRNLICDLSAQLTVLSGVSKNLEETKITAREILSSGKVYSRFVQLLRMQGDGEGSLSKLPKAAHQSEVLAPADGVIQKVDALKIGKMGVTLGVGRRRAEDPVVAASGFEILVRSGEKISKDQPLLICYHQNQEEFESVKVELQKSFQFGEPDFTGDNLIMETIE